MTRQPGPSWRSLRFWAKLCGFVAIVPLVIFIGGVTWLKWNAHAQRVAVAAIKEARGRLSYDWQEPDAPPASAPFSLPGFPEWLVHWNRSGTESEDGDPPAPPWLVSLLGRDCFGYVTSVSLPRMTRNEVLQPVGQLKRLKSLRLDGIVVTDRTATFLDGLSCLEDLTLVRSKLGKGALAHLAHFKNLQSLNLQGTNVDNASLASIQGLTALTDLNLSGTAIGGPGLNSLGALSKLQELNIDRTAIGDTGLSVLAKLPALTRLSMNGTRLSGTGFVHLKGLNSLEELSAEATSVGDSGLVHLSGLRALKVLELKGTAVGDAGLKCLAGLTNLEIVTLDRTRITDSGLAHLTALPHLVIVSVQHTKVTEAGIAAMKRQRAALQAQQLAATSSGVAQAKTDITDVDIVH